MKPYKRVQHNITRNTVLAWQHDENKVCKPKREYSNITKSSKLRLSYLSYHNGYTANPQYRTLYLAGVADEYIIIERRYYKKGWLP